MDRNQMILKLIGIYEEVISSKDANYYLNREAEIEQLFLVLQSQSDPYSESEKGLLMDLVKLNQAVQTLLLTSMSELQHARLITPKASKQYENPGIVDSYFYDRKY